MIYVEDPAHTPVQGLWLARPAPGDPPAFWCRQAVEGFAVRDRASARRFFRDVLRWSPAAVRLITGVRLLSPATPPPAPPVRRYHIVENAYGWPMTVEADTAEA